MERQLIRTTFSAVGATIMTPVGALAQQMDLHGHGYGNHMMGWGGGWFGMIFGPLFMILLLAVAIATAVVLVRWLAGSMTGFHMQQARPTALDVLAERFARGEIDKDEFEERRRLLAD
jgi:putative membrane protein